MLNMLSNMKNLITREIKSERSSEISAPYLNFQVKLKLKFKIAKFGLAIEIQLTFSNLNAALTEITLLDISLTFTMHASKTLAFQTL